MVELKNGSPLSRNVRATTPSFVITSVEDFELQKSIYEKFEKLLGEKREQQFSVALAGETYRGIAWRAQDQMLAIKFESPSEIGKIKTVYIMQSGDLALPKPDLRSKDLMLLRNVNQECLER